MLNPVKHIQRVEVDLPRGLAPTGWRKILNSSSSLQTPKFSIYSSGLEKINVIPQLSFKQVLTYYYRTEQPKSSSECFSWHQKGIPAVVLQHRLTDQELQLFAICCEKISPNQPRKGAERTKAFRS